MAATAAYTGLRQGELFALTAGQITAGARVITVDRKVIEVGGKLYLEAPKGRKRRSTIYPARTPAGYPLADTIAARIQQARAEQDAGTNPLGLMFPCPPRQLLAVLQLRPPRPGARLPGRRVARRRRQRRPGPGTACGTCSAPQPCSAGTWSATDVSCMAGHANVRVTLDMYVGTTAGVLDRARTATQ